MLFSWKFYFHKHSFAQLFISLIMFTFQIYIKMKVNLLYLLYNTLTTEYVWSKEEGEGEGRGAEVD